MRLAAIVLMLFIATLAGSKATETTTYSSSRFHAVIATATLSDLTAVPLYFSVNAGTFWSGETSRIATADGFYYQFSGTTKLLVDGKSTTLPAGEGVFVPAGTEFTLKTTDARPPTYLQFLLSPAPLARSDESFGRTIEIYRAPSPVLGLTRQNYILSLSKVPVPPQARPDPPHRRSGAALHYVLSGTGAEITESGVSVRARGSVSYEPSELVYQWSNPGLKPLIYLVFNLNPEDQDAVVVLNDPSHTR
jgi:mannose-6-phosphate isomerase-like protein (cupin superfamily)